VSSPDPGEARSHRYGTVLEYHGARFAGWQVQPRLRTVQGAIEEALADLLGRAVRVHGAGRTDAGVHARGQVAHFDAAFRHATEQLAPALNARLDHDVRVVSAHRVASDFHARYDALGKHYRYRLFVRGVSSPLDRGSAWWLRGPLDPVLLEEVLDAYRGRWDFRALHDGPAVPDAVRELYRVALERDGPRWDLHFEGDGFLQHMIRVLVGTAVAVARGRIDLSLVRRLLEHGGLRSEAGPTAPADGLTLMAVRY
jgi:tRNA pseudouridine38-40 synthase